MEKKLTTVQAARLKTQIGPMVSYLGRVQSRLEELGMNTDELYPVVCKAYSAVHHLSVVLHYQSVPRGVGRPEHD